MKISSVKKTCLKTCILSAAGILSAILVLAAVIILLAGWRKKDDPFLEVDNMTVSEEEFLLFVNSARASAAAHFYQQYGADSAQPGFWSTQEGGQTPAEYLLEEILPQIVRAKAVQSEMVRYGIIESADYSDFLKTYDETMDQRKKDAAAGRVIYGPEELPLMEFYSYYYGHCETQLRDIYKTEVLQFSEEDLRSYYEELKSTQLRPEVTGTVAFYESISDARANSAPEEIFTLSSRFAGKEDEGQQNLIHWMETAEEGSITGPAEYNGLCGYFVLTGREQQPLPDFGEIKDNLLWMYGDTVYEKELSEKCSRARIKMDQSYILRLIEKTCSS